MTSRLVIGTPRIPAKPPRRRPCTETRVAGGNILHDPGFESGGGGPSGDEIPAIGIGRTTVWSDAAAAPTSLNWAAFRNEASRRWSIETTDPDAGTFHAQTEITATGDGGALYILRLYPCDLILGPSVWNGMSAVVAPGDLVTFAVRIKATSITSTPTVTLHLEWFEGVIGPDSNDDDGGPVTLTTSYATVSFQATVPAAPNPGGLPTRFVRAYLERAAGATGTFIRVDSASLAIV